MNLPCMRAASAIWQIHLIDSLKQLDYCFFHLVSPVEFFFTPIFFETEKKHVYVFFNSKNFTSFSNDDRCFHESPNNSKAFSTTCQARNTSKWRQTFVVFVSAIQQLKHIDMTMSFDLCSFVTLLDKSLRRPSSCLVAHESNDHRLKS